MNNDLYVVLSDAYPCPAFNGACGSMRFQPDKGHVPRGFYGAFGNLNEVKLIMIMAEPGDPKENEIHTGLESAYEFAGKCYESGIAIGHRNVMRILRDCFTGASCDEIFRRTWLTESVLCSAAVTTGKILKQCENECYQRYLKRQLDLMPNAIVATMGGKAYDRVSRHTQREIIKCGAVFPPGCNQPAVGVSWNELIRKVKEIG